ncbi:MAG TPA: ABC transporter permease [Phototrophicaceae bacterium]|jgi:ribose transport system permease protein|nr:ABC transporter permease [Phototrophicaceae bacterium]
MWAKFSNMERENRNVVISYSMIVLLIIVGTLFITPNFASPTFLTQQLRLASFLGIIAAGQMAVILTGHIDLSIPWTMTLSAVLATSIAAGLNEQLLPGFVVGIAVGAAVGLVNGIGVAYLRIPSMVLTLGVNAVLKGITVVYTGSAPQFQQTPDLLSKAATEILFGFLPVAVILWALVSLMQYFILSRSGIGRKTYAVGNNEIAAYLSGVRTPRVLVMVFMLSGVLNAIAGLLLAGNAGRSFNEMGDPFLLPAIAAVVVGGTSIAGGSGKYIGTIAGVIIIRLLDGALNIVQVSPAAKDITFGLVILVMLFLYGRGEKTRE